MMDPGVYFRALDSEGVKLVTVTYRKVWINLCLHRFQFACFGINLENLSTACHAIIFECCIQLALSFNVPVYFRILISLVPLKDVNWIWSVYVPVYHFH